MSNLRLKRDNADSVLAVDQQTSFIVLPRGGLGMCLVYMHFVDLDQSKIQLG